MDFVPNGIAQIAFKKRHPGIAAKFDLDPNEEFIKIVPVRITAKLVSTALDRYSRATGKLQRYDVGKGKRVVAYRLSGKDWVTVE